MKFKFEGQQSKPGFKNFIILVEGQNEKMIRPRTGVTTKKRKTIKNELFSKFGKPKSDTINENNVFVENMKNQFTPSMGVN